MRSALRTLSGAITLGIAALLLQLSASMTATADSTWDSVTPGTIQAQVMDSTWD